MPSLKPITARLPRRNGSVQQKNCTRMPVQTTPGVAMSKTGDRPIFRLLDIPSPSESSVGNPSQQVSTQLSTNSRLSNNAEDKLDRCFGSPIITIYAGPEKIPFHIHQGVLIETSGYFREKFGDLANEDRKIFLNFPNDDPDVVHRFVTFMYRPRQRLFSDSDPMNFESIISTLAKIYLLAIRFEIPDLEFRANRELFKRLDTETDEGIQDLEEDKFRDDLEMRIATMREVYTRTTSTYDPLRKTLVTNMARHWECYSGKGGMADQEDGSESELSKFIGEVPRFAKDLLRYLRNSSPGDFLPPHDTSTKKRKWSDS